MCVAIVQLSVEIYQGKKTNIIVVRCNCWSVN